MRRLTAAYPERDRWRQRSPPEGRPDRRGKGRNATHAWDVPDGADSSEDGGGQTSHQTGATAAASAPAGSVGAMKDLTTMSLEELWQLFPIVLKEHDPAYREWYEEERARLSAVWGPRLARISHIGSTAVPGLLAKPTVDILMELDPDVDPREVLDRTLDEGWLAMSGTPTRPVKLVFNKGYTPEGFARKVFHLHVRTPGDWDELYFRDYLIDHPGRARQYAHLKMELKGRYEHDRDAYTQAKGSFIGETTALARAAYPSRHLPRPRG